MNMKKTAVVVIDLQNDYVDENGVIAKAGLGVGNLQKALPKIKKFLDSMRAKNVPVVHIQMTEGAKYVPKNLFDKRNDTFGPVTEWELAVPGTWGYELVFTPCENELVFKKNTYDVFSNPEVKKYLDSLGVETLIVLGGYTHACVDTTVRSAFTQGYKVVLATDLVGAPDVLKDLHENALRVLTMQFAFGLESDDIISLLDCQ